MSKVVFAAVAAAALLVSSLGMPSSANASTPVVVRLPRCLDGGGQATVPAGSDVTIGIAWISMARAGVSQFLDAVEATAEIDGTSIDAEDFGPITRNLVPLGGARADLPSYWGTQWTHELGTLDEGEEVVVTFSWVVTERILDVNLTLSPPAIFFGPGVVIEGSCTIRAESED